MFYRINVFSQLILRFHPYATAWGKGDARQLARGPHFTEFPQPGKTLYAGELWPSGKYFVIFC